ncbi:hypothetical protein B0H19DRAFT_573357 [Mycena capillaripes]|nr:hypothetical protein B0H19DRAFT_573357 [Mycena capillaripes]
MDNVRGRRGRKAYGENVGARARGACIIPPQLAEHMRLSCCWHDGREERRLPCAADRGSALDAFSSGSPRGCAMHLSKRDGDDTTRASGARPSPATAFTRWRISCATPRRAARDLGLGERGSCRVSRVAYHPARDTCMCMHVSSGAKGGSWCRSLSAISMQERSCVTACNPSCARATRCASSQPRHAERTFRWLHDGRPPSRGHRDQGRGGWGTQQYGGAGDVYAGLDLHGECRTRTAHR